MKIYFWEGPEGNIGDDLNLWLWPRLFGEHYFSNDATDVFLGIGSILDRRHDRPTRKLLFGAGARSADTVPDVTSDDWTVAFVRGPRTAQALGLGSDQWVSDPAILTPLADPRFVARDDHRPDTTHKLKVGFIPYFATQRAFSDALAQNAGFELIPPTLSVERFLKRLVACDVVVSEAMHGAILADAFGIPWIPCQISSMKKEGATHRFKWADWLETLDLKPTFTRMHYSQRNLGKNLLADNLQLILARRGAANLRRRVAERSWYLSDRGLLAERQQRMLSHVQDHKTRATHDHAAIDPAKTSFVI